MVSYLLSTLFFLNLIASSVYLVFKALLVWAKNGVNERFRYIGCIAVMVLFLIPFYQALLISSATKDIPSQTSGYLEGVSSVIPKDEVVQKNTSVTESNSMRTIGFGLDVQTQEKILVVWSVGVSALALWYIAVLLKFRRKLSQKQTQPVCGELQQIANHCASEYGIRQTPILRASPHVQSPVLIGFFKPIIAVPADGLPPADVQMILKHELVHFKRRDLWWKLLGVVIQTIHWVNPIVWLLCNDFEFYAETSCDAQVVHNLDHDGRKSYGYLLILYSKSQRKLNPMPGISFISSREKLKRRIYIMLNGNKSKKLIATALVCVLGASSFALSAFAAEVQSDTPQAINGIVAGKDVSTTSSDELLTGETQTDIPFAQSINPNNGYDLKGKEENSFADMLTTTMNAPLEIPDEFRQSVANGEVTPLQAEDGVAVEALDANGVKMSVNTDAEQYAFCDHRTEDVYVQRHLKYTNGSCKVELYSGVRCTKCAKVWVHDLLSTTTFPQCPH